MVAFAGLAAILDTWYFTGGKSVATSLGVLLAMSWQVGLGTLGVWRGNGVVADCVSSIAGAILVSVLMLLGQLPYLLFAGWSVCHFAASQ